MLPIASAPYRCAPIPAGIMQGLQARAHAFVKRDLPHWLGNLGSIFPTAVGRGVMQAGTAYAGQRVANLVQSGLDEWSQDNPGLAFCAETLMVIAGGSLIAWQAGILLESGRQARAAHLGQPAPDMGVLLPALVGLVTATGPIATAFIAHNVSREPRQGCEVLSTVMGIYLGNLLGRDLGNEVLLRMPLDSYQGAKKLHHHAAIVRRGWDMMLTSLVFNIPLAAAGHFWLRPALSGVDPALAPSILRGAWTMGNTLAQGWAASLDGEDGTVRPKSPGVERPRLDMAKCFEETAMRSFLALVPTLLLKLSDEVSNSEPACYALLVAYFIAQGVGEWRGPLRELGCAGHHLDSASAAGPDAAKPESAHLDVARENPLSHENLQQMQEILNEAGRRGIVVVRRDGTRTDLDTVLREREIHEQISTMAADPHRTRLSPAMLRQMQDTVEGALRDFINSQDNEGDRRGEAAVAIHTPSASPSSSADPFT